MVQTNLYKVLSGLCSSVSGVHDNFIEYDKELSGLLSSIDDINNTESETIVYEVKPKYTVLSGQTSYSLESGKLYRCEIINDTNFTLPNVENADVLQEIILTVKFNDVYYVKFYTQENAEIAVNGLNDWDNGDVVQYLCRYEPFLSKWVIIPMEMI